MANTTLATLDYDFATTTLAFFRLKEVAAAAATLLIYDYATSFSEEVDHFWNGDWTVSRVLYFSIRYLSLAWALLQVFGLLIFNMDKVTYTWISLFHILPIVTIGQATITLRVWFLFLRTPIIRRFAVTVSALCISGTYISAGVLWHKIKGQVLALESIKNTNDHSSVFVWLFVPSLVLHSVLFALKVCRFITSPTYLQTDTLLWRFMKEGMLMYVFALASLLYSIIALTSDDLSTYLPAWNGLMVVTTVVISVCRAMLSIRSLASTGHVAPAWLLNHAEMSRVQWRRGAAEGEIVVEMPNEADLL